MVMHGGLGWVSPKKGCRVTLTQCLYIALLLCITTLSKKRLQYSLAVFVGFLYSSLAVPGLYYFLDIAGWLESTVELHQIVKISINLKQHYKGGGWAAKQVSRIIE